MNTATFTNTIATIATFTNTSMDAVATTDTTDTVATVAVWPFGGEGYTFVYRDMPELRHPLGWLVWPSHTEAYVRSMDKFENIIREGEELTADWVAQSHCEWDGGWVPWRDGTPTVWTSSFSWDDAQDAELSGGYRRR